ncbi:sesquipedalian-1 isoform X1 [Procambarus clarkii]|uniref:sesquipedalian-1 isoform X1 n=1 Tax=Procambarus clarkii TaxID=6728 RepID=UPI003742D8C4
MKINEKNLCAYSVSPTQIDKEGYLLKKGEVNKSFQRRWFVLKGNLLFYFEKKGDREPIGVIILEGCTIELAECEDQYTFKLLFHGGGGRTYVLAADSQESLEAWMKALARASYDYLKLMVAELQKQLDELNDAEMQAKGGGEDNALHPPKAPHRQRQNPFNRTQSVLYLIMVQENIAVSFIFRCVGWMSNFSSNEVTLDPSLAMRMRANTVSGGQYLTPTTVPQRAAPPPPSVAHITINKRTFAQLHSEYGVLILRDKELNRAKMGRKGKLETLEKMIPKSETRPEGSTTENVVMDLITI